MFKLIRLAFFLCMGISSCIPHKRTVYFQNKKASLQTIQDSITALNTDTHYKVHSGDLLYISITSMNKEVSDFYNLTNLEKTTSYLTFYLIDDSGNVTIPMLGKIEVKNLTLEQVQYKTLQRVRETVKDASVIVKLGAFKVTVLGDVNVPNIVSIEGERGTIFDALALAGDIASTGNRENVKIIREMDTGQKNIIVLDLSDQRIIQSKQIYLRPNDVVYVEPLKAKAARLNLAQIGRITAFASIFYVTIRIMNLIK